MFFKFISPAILVIAVLASGLLQAAPQELTAKSRASLGLIIYEEDLALISEAFLVHFPVGESELNFRSISPSINAHSAVLHPLPETLSVRDQYFRQALTADDLLEKSLGQTISLVSTHPVTGVQKRERARLISVKDGLILEIDGHFETSLTGRTIVYDSLPNGVLKPVLSVGVTSSVAKQSMLYLSYLSSGLSWKADYIARLNASGEKLQLQSMASISNHSGVDFLAADVELIAGSINRVSENANVRRQLAATAMRDSAPAIQPAPLRDTYVYSLPRQADLNSNSVRQIKLFEAHDVPVEQHYRLAAQPGVYHSPGVPEQALVVDSYIEFTNSPDSHLGGPLPAGVVRVFVQQDAQAGRLRFIGEDRIGHMPTNARVRLKLGKAFDLRGTRKQLSYRRLPAEEPYRQHNESQLQIVLSNAKNKPVVVQIEEAFSGEWVLVDGPKPAFSDAHSARWDVPVPAEGEAVLDFTVRIKR